MPSKSARQHNFMEAAAHNPSFAKRANIPQKVAKEFVSADQGAQMRHTGSDKKKTAPGFSRGRGGSRTCR